jgi:16S rRNA (adenine1518-N6/adenine1519-N6)-dimethyltransferase
LVLTEDRTVQTMPGPPTIREQLLALGIRPKKGLGQNFLIDQVHLQRIVEAAELTREDAVLEVGPGLGPLTDLLAERAGLVTAVELDDRLISYLRVRFGLMPHVQIVHGDILAEDPGALIATASAEMRRLDAGVPAQPLPEPPHYKAIANLPYYITSAVVRHLLEATSPPTLSVLTVQREVAQRMVASPPDMSLLALGVQFYCTAEISGYIPAGAFYPKPKVDSAFVRLVRRPQPVVAKVTPEAFFQVARAGFSQPRKQLRNSLAAGLRWPSSDVAAWLTAAEIDPRRRAETLSLEEWGALALSLPAHAKS